MTPLALSIVKQALLPASKRSMKDDCGLLDRMSGVHCFEVSEVMELAVSMIASGALDAVPDDDGVPDNRKFGAMASATSFLPAPKTWMEWREKDFRQGVLLIEDGDQAEIRQAAGRKAALVALPPVVRSGLGARGGDAHEMVVPETMDAETISDWSALVPKLHILLAFINTPRVIGRTQHPPHRGLQRTLSRGGPGAFEVHDWTEIKLEVATNEDAEQIEVGAEHVSGQKALHFCRSHLRIRHGRVEIVRAHWRGDASLGVRPSRYRVVPPKT